MKANRNIIALFFGMIFMINLGIAQTSDMDSSSLAFEKSTLNMVHILSEQLKLSTSQKVKIAQLYQQHFDTEKTPLDSSKNDFEEDIMLVLTAEQKEKFNHLISYNHTIGMRKNYHKK